MPEEVACPFEVSHIWSWFIDLDRTRTSGMGMNPITFEEIGWYARLKKISMIPFEVEAISRIDAAYISYQNTESKRKHG